MSTYLQSFYMFLFSPLCFHGRSSLHSCSSVTPQPCFCCTDESPNQMIPQIRLNGYTKCCCFGKTSNSSPFQYGCIKLWKCYISSIFPEFPEQRNSFHCVLGKQQGGSAYGYRKHLQKSYQCTSMITVTVRTSTVVQCIKEDANYWRGHQSSLDFSGT